MTGGMLVATLATMLTPVLARLDVALVITCRVLVGMGTVRKPYTFVMIAEHSNGNRAAARHQCLGTECFFSRE